VWRLALSKGWWVSVAVTQRTKIVKGRGPPQRISLPRASERGPLCRVPGIWLSVKRQTLGKGRVSSSKNSFIYYTSALVLGCRGQTQLKLNQHRSSWSHFTHVDRSTRDIHSFSKFVVAIAVTCSFQFLLDRHPSICTCTFARSAQTCTMMIKISAQLLHSASWERRRTTRLIVSWPWMIAATGKVSLTHLSFVLAANKVVMSLIRFISTSQIISPSFLFLEGLPKSRYNKVTQCRLYHRV